MNKVSLLISCLALTTLLSCTKRYVCGLSYSENQSIPSKVLKFGREFLPDSSRGILMGTMYRYENENNTEPLIFGMVLAIDIHSKMTKGEQTDLDGKFHFIVEPSIYNIEFRNTGYNSVIIKNVSIKSGERIHFDAVVGDGWVNYVFELQSDGSLKNTYSY